MQVLDSKCNVTVFAYYIQQYNMRINTKKTKVMRISQVEGRPIRTAPPCQKTQKSARE